MIGKLSLQHDRLLSILGKGITDYCKKYYLPRIFASYGYVSGAGGIRFKYEHSLPHIVVHPKLSKYLLRRNEFGRVYYLLEAIGHEMTHYRQYLRARAPGIPITKKIFLENEAYAEGMRFANTEIWKFDSKEINPILPAIGSGIVSGVGLGIGFKAIDAAWNKMTKKNPRRRKCHG